MDGLRPTTRARWLAIEGDFYQLLQTRKHSFEQVATEIGERYSVKATTVEAILYRVQWMRERDQERAANEQLNSA
jgi:hypothetical protein